MNYVPEMRLRVVKEDMVFFRLCLVAGLGLLAMLAVIVYLAFAWSAWAFLGCPQVRV